jgi:hypothetical protein
MLRIARVLPHERYWMGKSGESASSYDGSKVRTVW